MFMLIPIFQDNHRSNVITRWEDRDQPIPIEEEIKLRQKKVETKRLKYVSKCCGKKIVRPSELNKDYCVGCGKECGVLLSMDNKDDDLRIKQEIDKLTMMYSDGLSSPESVNGRVRNHILLKYGIKE